MDNSVAQASQTGAKVQPTDSEVQASMSSMVQRFLRQRREPSPPESEWKEGKLYRVKNRSKQTIRLMSVADHKTVRAIINLNTARVMSAEELQDIEPSILDGLQGEGKISIRELNYNRDTEYTVKNLTAKRISIRHNAFRERDFFLPAFGSRTVSGDTLLELDYLGWEGQGLIEIKEVGEEDHENKTAYAIIGLTAILLVLFWITGILLILFAKGIMSWTAIGIGTAVGIAIIVASLFFTKEHRAETFFANLWSQLNLLFGIVLMLGVGIGLPLAIIYFFGGGEQLLLTKDFGLGFLGRVLQAGFISIASMLPAFLFYLFGRQQVTKQKENFYREAMLLDPNVWSISEAQNKYDSLLNSVFDTGDSPFSILLLIISTALLVTGWIITLSPIGPSPTTIPNLVVFFTPDKSPFTLGFLGAYFFTINMIFRRYVRSDLTPKTYAYITIRLLITVVLVWAVSILPQFSAGSFLETGLSVVAFIIGIFPETGLTLIQEFVNKTIIKRGEYLDRFSLTKLEGINLYDQARLMEEGIENIENLAHHDLMELIARTRIPTARIIDMFDQSILYLHLGKEIDNAGGENGEDASKTNEDVRDLLKSLGVRTATDLIRCQDEITDFKDEEKYKNVVKKIKVIVASFKDDEWFNYVDSWRKTSSQEGKPIDDPYKFYFRAAGVAETPPKEPPAQLPKKNDVLTPHPVG